MSKGLGAGYLENSKMHSENMRGWMKHNGCKVALPRYYRDRMFTDDQKELLNMQNENEIDKVFWEELDRLIAMDVYRPLEYIKDQKQMLHDRIKVKSLKLNTL